MVLRGRALAVWALGLFFFCVFGFQPARSQTQDDAWSTTVKNAMAWVQANSPYTELTSPRFWVSLSPDDMAAKVLDRNVTAYYVCSETALYYRTDFDVRNLFGASILIHELVHHGQCITRRARNSCAWEQEAYAIQAKFLRSYKARQDAANAERLERVASQVEQTANQACEQMRAR
ncbi:MAG: hypothetical protein EXQ89_07830 [Rhodospirillaceae bacterium]|nr:hypothetical protein [Rhodospirillaceae bacterium]